MSQGSLPATPAAAVNDHTSTVTNRQTFTLAGFFALIMALATTWQTMNGTATVKDAIAAIKPAQQPVIIQPPPVQPAPVVPLQAQPPATGLGADEQAIILMLRTNKGLRDQLLGMTK